MTRLTMFPGVWCGAGSTLRPVESAALGIPPMPSAAGSWPSQSLIGDYGHGPTSSARFRLSETPESRAPSGSLASNLCRRSGWLTLLRIHYRVESDELDETRLADSPFGRSEVVQP